MYEQRRPDVAVFIDFENVYVSVRDKLNANPNFEAIMDRCGDLGRVVIARAYADWYRYPRVTSALYANAIEPIYVATYYYDKDAGRTGRAIKNSVDMNLCIDAMKTLFTNTNISKFVLVTGDRDFIPLVTSIRQQGKEVYIIGIGGAASTHLAQSADEFVFYEQLVGRQAVASVAATAIANRATELVRGLEPPIEPPAPPPAPVAPVPAAPVPAAPVAPPAAPAEDAIYAVLVEAIHLVRKRGYVSTLGSIKLVMKELMGGDFKESRYRDLSGRPFAKFKDFVLDAEKRGKVQIFTNGTVNEVFLPGEDAQKLSQFAAALSEEVPIIEPIADLVVTSNGRKDSPRPVVAEAPAAPAAPTGRRRRRRSRRGQGSTNGSDLDALLSTAELEGDEPDYTAPDLEALPEPEADEPSTVEALPVLEAAPVAETADESAPELLGAPLETFAPELVPHYEIAPDLLAAAGLILDAEPLTLGAAEPEAESEAVSEPELVLPDLVEDELQAPVGDPSAEEVAVADAAAEAVLSEFEAEPAAEAPVAEAFADPIAAVALSEPVTDVVPEATPEPELVALAAETVAVAAEPESAADAEAAEVLEEIDFTAEEWEIFTEMMRGFSKPVSFQQIFDGLRNLRQQQRLTRTNEQLRTMAKQAINGGTLERSGRGKRIYYALRADA